MPALTKLSHLVIVIMIFIVAASVRFLHRTIGVVPFDLCSNQHHSVSVVISVVCFMVTMASLLQLRPDSPPNDQLSPIKFPQSSAPFHFRIHQRPTTVWPGLMPASISTFRFEVFFPTPRAILHTMAMELLIELHLTLLLFNVWVNSSPYAKQQRTRHSLTRIEPPNLIAPNNYIINPKNAHLISVIYFIVTWLHCCSFGLIIHRTINLV